MPKTGFIPWVKHFLIFVHKSLKIRSANHDPNFVHDFYVFLFFFQNLNIYFDENRFNIVGKSFSDFDLENNFFHNFWPFFNIFFKIETQFLLKWFYIVGNTFSDFYCKNCSKSAQPILKNVFKPKSAYFANSRLNFSITTMFGLSILYGVHTVYLSNFLRRQRNWNRQTVNTLINKYGCSRNLNITVSHIIEETQLVDLLQLS